MDYKFRYWNKSEKKMVYDLHFCKNVSDLDVANRVHRELIDFNKILADENYVFMILIGKDKNGKDVWESDIIKAWDRGGVPVFNGMPFILGNHTYFNNPHDIEVVGNKYENPEINAMRSE